MEASQETCVCVSECVHYMQRDEQSGSKTEGLTSVLGQQKYFIALLKEAVMMLPKSNTSKWFTHTHPRTQKHTIHPPSVLTYQLIGPAQH